MKDTIMNWLKNVVGGAIGSKKTLATAAAIGCMGIFIGRSALICATICFVAWIAAQAYVDTHGKQ